ncbi:MAG: hypothetical protein K8U57_26250 [Planctomycetes bacterium]|nr:hypothetical protein [Planctomycetota bacterium]
MTTDALPTLHAGVTNLFLARLATPSRKPASVSDLRTDVGRVLGRSFGMEEYAELITNLLSEGLIEPRPRSRGGVQLTEAGRAAAFEYLGVPTLPAGANWKLVREKYLFPKAIGAGGADVGKLNNADRLGAFLIRREYNLAGGGTLRSALEALVCKLVGHPNQTTLDELFRVVLSDKLDADEVLSKADLLKQFPCKLAGARSGKLDDLRAAVLAEWMRDPQSQAQDNPLEQPDSDVEPEPFDPLAFAATVKRIARDSGSDARFGSNKAFVAAVWQASQTEDSFPKMSLVEFKDALADASRDGLIRLEPADLVQAMNPKLVADSEITRAGAKSHFILLEETRL